MSEESNQSKLRRAMIGTYVVIYTMTTFAVSCFMPYKWNLWCYIVLFTCYIAVYYWSKSAILDLRKNGLQYEEIMEVAEKNNTSIAHFPITKIIITLGTMAVCLLLTKFIQDKISSLIYYSATVPIATITGYAVGYFITSFKFIPKEHPGLENRNKQVQADSLMQSIDDYYYGIFPNRYYTRQSTTDYTYNPTSPNYQSYDPNRFNR